MKPFLKDHLGNNLLQFKQIPAFADNYLWVIICNHSAWVVDPGDAQPLIAYFEKETIQLAGILITHHHQDHIGGVRKMQDWALQQGYDIQTYGPKHPDITNLTGTLSQGDVVEIFPGQILQVFAVPGHTLSHIAYFLPQTIENPIPRLYCGDTLFAAGCGRLFEGTAAQMFTSMQKLAGLPDQTLVCCAHEYTMANLRFAQFVDPDNIVLNQWYIDASQLRSDLLPTVPTTLGLEKKVNPFMRCHEEALIRSAEKNVGHPLQSPIDVFAIIRKMKDQF